MIVWLLVLIIVFCTVLSVLALGAIALRLSMLDRERLRQARVPALLAFTPGGGTQTGYELLLGSAHRRVGDRFLSSAVWTLRLSSIVEIAAWIATWFIGS